MTLTDTGRARALTTGHQPRSRTKVRTESSATALRTNSRFCCCLRCCAAKDRLVARLRPSKALAQIDSVSITEAVRTMAEKRFDATLLVDSEGGLSGILTDKGACVPRAMAFCLV